MNAPIVETSLDISFLRSRTALRRLTIVTLTGALIGLLYGLLAPKWYRSVLTVVPTKSQKGGGLSSMLGSDLAGFAAGLDASISGADVQRIAAVLQSIAVTDAVIAKFNLRARYKEKYQENTREVLWKHCDVKPLPKPNLVQLSCEDRDPRFVQDMLAYFAEYGNQVFSRVGVSSASEQVRFLEKRVAELRQQADDTASRMREFQEKHQIIDLDTQTKAVVADIASLHSQRITKQLELEYARTFSSRDEATLQQLQSQIAVMESKLRDLEEPSAATPEPADTRRPHTTNPVKRGIFPAALSVPKLRAEFEILYRDRKVAEATLVFALERLEGARADQARDVSTFLVLDPPALPTRPSRPKLLIALLACAVLGIACGVGLEWWKTNRTSSALFGLRGSPESEAVQISRRENTSN